MTYPSLHFLLVGTPVPWQRARRNGNRSYTAPAMLAAQQAIRDAWKDAGAVRLPDVPLALEVTASFARPPGHYGTKGTLNAAGRRAIPGGRSDIDNVCLKSVMDALNGLAWSDDRFICHAVAEKRWAARGEPAKLEVLAWAPSPEDAVRP